MPSYADSLEVPQWLDLVAYLKGLTEGGEHPEGHGIERVAAAGDYRIRLVYTGRHHAASRATGHLMAFITARETGEAVPYFRSTATAGAGTPAGRSRSDLWSPTIAHYGPAWCSEADTKLTPSVPHP